MRSEFIALLLLSSTLLQLLLLPSPSLAEGRKRRKCRIRHAKSRRDPSDGPNSFRATCKRGYRLVDEETALFRCDEDGRPRPLQAGGELPRCVVKSVRHLTKSGWRKNAR